ncbi:uncharacterized protein BO97DRAFT_16386 [Aspergillus homomorphus CBS 101889]|uniref:Uncharacterized protein n=1 Tax=Aspergillus homomorphus (strain CBS 101889) TaxID=1450537 RepID=A0A395I212_ASPHC|nr:hypothetical protein BO97DRAFT_16386 [Aspergillus homomorphus CBS 101889]RAL13977.1 hypothetical protein BO97DRAFT_16386 [Aspergillus homomorphus CBS 101889]
MGSRTYRETRCIHRPYGTSTFERYGMVPAVGIRPYRLKPTSLFRDKAFHYRLNFRFLSLSTTGVEIITTLCFLPSSSFIFGSLSFSLSLSPSPPDSLSDNTCTFTHTHTHTPHSLPLPTSYSLLILSSISLFFISLSPLLPVFSHLSYQYTCQSRACRRTRPFFRFWLPLELGLCQHTKSGSHR